MPTKNSPNSRLGRRTQKKLKKTQKSIALCNGTFILRTVEIKTVEPRRDERNVRLGKAKRKIKKVDKKTCKTKNKALNCYHF